MKRIFIPTRTGSDWQPLLAKPVLHWKKGASAMTVAASWEAAAGQLPSEITGLLDSAEDEYLNSLKLLIAIPEWEVPLAGGETTSNTDVLAVCRNNHGLSILAVEAKVLEDFGPLVGQKRAETSEGQSARLEYLQSLLHVHRFDDTIRYQLVHRTASALLTAREFHAACAVMLIQAFDTPPSRRNDFASFCAAMNAIEVAPLIFKVTDFSCPRLYLAWCDGDSKFRSVELPSAL